MSLRGRRRGGGRKNELVFLTTCGPATTFDPKITGVDGVWYFDDGTTLAAASGAEISKTFAADGLHRAVYRPRAGGLAAITAIVINQDLLVGNISEQFAKCANINYIVCYTNLAAYGSMRALMRLPLTQIIIGNCHMSGDLSDLRAAMYIIDINYTTELTGTVSSLPASTQYARLYNCPNVTSGSISHCTAAKEIRFDSMGWLTADVDTVIDSMWAARANYTWAAPALNIGGTNQAPTGNVTAPVEGSDWHLDGATWIPLTSGAKIWDLAKNVNSEARTAAWTITYTGGSIAP